MAPSTSGFVVAVVVAALAFAVRFAPPSAASDPCAAPVVNVIACENSQPGDPASDWQVAGAGDASIQGFATSISVNVGETVTFKIDTSASSYHIDILRMGYYNGDGARKLVAGLAPSASLPQSQPACLTDATSGLIDCGNWAVSASWAVPTSAVSGVYLAHLVRDDTGGSSLIPFVVRNDASTSDLIVQTSDESWEAYNTYGGNSLYQCTVACPPGNPGGYKGAYKVSYNRPFHSGADDNGASWVMYAEYPMIRFLEANGYDVSYMSGLDVATRGSLLTNHKVFLSVGHDEYWSGDQRANVVAARDHGLNLAFFSGNEVYWKTRWEPSIDGSNTANRTLVTYKETHFDAPTDPADPTIWTGTWRDPRFSPAADGGQPENALTGQYFIVNSGTTDIQVPASYAALRLWRNTPVAGLTGTQVATLGAGLGTLGYEWDEEADDGFRPAGLFDLSATTSSTAQTFVDYGTNVADNRTATHHLSLYRAASGALVFGAGTVQWSWGLDGATTGKAPDRTMQQATVNLFADMHVQPSTPISGLLLATASTDTTAPTSTITAPAPGGVLQDGSTVTISGTAGDTGGGVVAGVEVSTDGGSSWHPATGTANWSYRWVAHGAPHTTILSRAVDDSGNLETPAGGTTVDVSCPCSLWGSGTTPGSVDSGDGTPVEIGVKFASDSAGTVTGIRFYKASTNTGTHVGHLWTLTGQVLASVTFTNETASGWQDATFSTPVSIDPDTTYVASYYAPNGHYSADGGFLYNHPAAEPDGDDTTASGPLHAVRNSTSTVSSLYSYAAASTFPTSTYNATNYWVDVDFTPVAPSPPGAPTSVVANAGDGQASVTWNAPTGGSTLTTSYTVTPFVGTTAQAPTTVTGNPPATTATITGLTNGTAYSFTVTATDSVGTGQPSAASNTVTPQPATAPDAPTGVTATAANGSATVSWTAPSANRSPITSYSVTPYVGGAAQQPTTVTGSPPATTATITGLTNGASYTFTVAATNAVGTGPSSAASNPVVPSVPVGIYAGTETPANPDANDPNAVELGVQFQVSATAQVIAIRFYKGGTNTGQHTGHLWSPTGALLASVTFTDETASGWQTAYLSTPVTVEPGTTYTASYWTGAGNYAYQSAAFANGPIGVTTEIRGSQGVYNYGSNGSTAPAQSYNNTAYYVDALVTTS